MFYLVFLFNSLLFSQLPDSLNILQNSGDSFNDSVKFHADSTFNSSTFKDSTLTSIDKFESNI